MTFQRYQVLIESSQGQIIISYVTAPDLRAAENAASDLCCGRDLVHSVTLIANDK